MGLAHSAQWPESAGRFTGLRAFRLIFRGGLPAESGPLPFPGADGRRDGAPAVASGDVVVGTVGFAGQLGLGRSVSRSKAAVISPVQGQCLASQRILRRPVVMSWAAAENGRNRRRRGSRRRAVLGEGEHRLPSQQVESDLDDLEPAPLKAALSCGGARCAGRWPGGPDPILGPGAQSVTEFQFGDRPVRGVGPEARDPHAVPVRDPQPGAGTGPSLGGSASAALAGSGPAVGLRGPGANAGVTGRPCGGGWRVRCWGSRGTGCCWSGDWRTAGGCGRVRCRARRCGPSWARSPSGGRVDRRDPGRRSDRRTSPATLPKVVWGISAVSAVSVPLVRPAHRNAAAFWSPAPRGETPSGGCVLPAEWRRSNVPPVRVAGGHLPRVYRAVDLAVSW